MAGATPEYALAIPHKAIACLYLGGFSADNHARILPPRFAIEVIMATRPAQTEPDLTGDTRVPAPSYKYIQFDVVDSIARLTLNHAPHNVLTVP